MTLTPSAAGASRRRRPGRPTTVDAEAIADAVLAVGFRGLTFAEVAARLGVGQATLYRHAANRDELIRYGMDLALRRISWPDLDGPWKPLLERWALASWHAWEAHPGAVLEATRGIVPSSMVSLSDRVGVALVERGFTPRHAVLAVDLVFDLAADSRRGVEAMDAVLDSEPVPVREAMEREWGDRQGVDDVAARLRGEMVRAIQEEPVTWFHGKLRIVLAGIEQELAPAPTPEEIR